MPPAVWALNGIINQTGTATIATEANRITMPRAKSGRRPVFFARLSTAACTVWDIFETPFTAFGSMVSRQWLVNPSETSEILVGTSRQVNKEYPGARELKIHFELGPASRCSAN